MGSISSTPASNSNTANPALENLLQTLTSAGSPLSSSPSVVSALENAPPADIVQLSVAATQLQGVDMIFGDDNSTTPDSSDPFATLPDPSQGATTNDSSDPLAGILNSDSSSDPFDSSSDPLIASLDSALLAANGSSATDEGSGASSQSASSAAQIAANAASTQAAETAALFGAGNATTPDSLLSVLG